MRITQYQLRKIIREELYRSLLEAAETVLVDISDTDRDRISSIFNKAISDVVSYINEPDSSANSFRSRLNAKLKKLDLASLTDSDISEFENKFSNIELKYMNQEEGPVAFWNGTNITLNIKYIDNEEEVSNTMYHELYHAMTMAMLSVVGRKRTIDQLKFDNASIAKAKGQKGSAGNELGRPLRYVSIDTFYQLFEDEFDTIIDKGALSGVNKWKEKIKQSRNKGLKRYINREMPGLFQPTGKKYDNDIQDILSKLSGDEHYYVALKQLRDIFPKNTITSACNASSQEIARMEYWTVMFLSVLNCSSQADQAWDRVAIKADTDKSQDSAIA